ncbi:MAG TPA: hypothetical protein VMW25_00255, partial [Clostridia bacterium]|nr:hypothetical protein [Clostridia bacterium]
AGAGEQFFLNNTWGAAYPDTFSCDTQPVIEFPSEVTLSKTYLITMVCDDPKTVPGDFVTVYAATIDGEHVKNISEYEVTEQGVEWISPLTDSNGNAWTYVELNQQFFSCNSTGVPYTMHTHWDGQHTDVNFSVFCPTINLTYYREELPYWDQLKVNAQVVDNKGYLMKGIPCSATVLDVVDGNYFDIKQENLTVITDSSGTARFEFESGMLSNLLQGYEYTTTINCLGGEQDFSFTVEQSDDSYLRNPLYYSIVFLSDNIVPIIFAFLIAGIAITFIYFLIKRE